MTLTYFTVKLGHLYVWMGKSVTKSFNGGKLAAKDYIDWIILLMKKIWPQGVICPCPGAIYMYMTTIFKHLLHWNRLANQSQILCGASLGRGNDSLYKWPPRPYMVKTFKNLLLQNRKSYDIEIWHAASGIQVLQSLNKWWPWVDLDLFYGKVKLGRLYVWMGKTVTKSFNGENLQQMTELTE